MQHGQNVEQPPRSLLVLWLRRQAEGHLCCGSTGTYNVLQSELATRLRERKLAHVARTGAAVVATGNVGGITAGCLWEVRVVDPPDQTVR